jgi:maleylacetoacetate isomerase
MLLYDYFRSSAAYRVRIALNLKGLAYEHRSIHLRKGEQRSAEYLATNPQGLVPTLVVGSLALTQSLAIMEYLEERHPLPPLLPESAEDRAWVRAIADIVACDIHPINNTRVIQYLQSELQIDDARRDAWYAHWIRLGFEAIEKRLAERGGGPFAIGDKPGLADICIIPQVANAGRVKLPMEPYPRIRALNAACLALPAFDKARPENHPDRE